MAPRGGKGGRTAGRETKSSSLNSKSTAGGGIQKRRGPTRVDNDGDLDMGSGAARRSTPASGDSKGRGGGKSNTRGASKTAQTILKHLTNGDASQLASRVTNPSAAKAARSRAQNATPLQFLRVHGLKQSKAASNRDGGISDLLSFLERKASSFLTGRKRQVKIKKVCYNRNVLAR